MIYDTAIILAQELNKDKSLSQQTKLRTDLGIEYYKTGKVKNLIMSGGHEDFGEKYGISLAEVMKKYALEQGIPKKDIFKEEASWESVGQLIFCKLGIIDPKQMKKILVVSNDYYIKRIKTISGIVFNKDYIINFAVAEIPLTQEKRQEVYVRERISEETFKKIFGKVTPGNNEELLKILLEKHIIYSRNPQYFKKNLDKLIALHQIKP